MRLCRLPIDLPSARIRLSHDVGLWAVVDDEWIYHATMFHVLVGVVRAGKWQMRPDIRLRVHIREIGLQGGSDSRRVDTVPLWRPGIYRTQSMTRTALGMLEIYSGLNKTHLIGTIFAILDFYKACMPL